MASRYEEIPLFPLNTVLFPYGQLQLHIFEEKYRLMVRECLEYDRPFGVALIRAGSDLGEPHLIGTAARITEARHDDDGTIDLLVTGERRFRVRKLDESRPYLMAQVEPVFEDPWQENARADELLLQARDTFLSLVKRILDHDEFSVEVAFPNDDPAALSFTIAAFLPMEDADKQRMLETTDTLERLEDILPILQEQLLTLEDKKSYTRLRSSDLREWVYPN